MSYMRDAQGVRLDTVATTSGRTSSLAAVSGRLKRGTEDVVLAVLSDSTGNETTEWVYLTAQWLAARFPAYTVVYRLWNDTNQNYDAAVTIQTGTGSRTLTIYNASTPGMAAGYSLTRIAAQIPVAPTAVIINYGHNSPSATLRSDNFQLVRAVREKYPNAVLALTAQNPRGAADANYADALIRQQINIDLAQSEGYGLINVFQTFLANPTYATDWLQGDNLHPNVTGSQKWAAEVQKHLAADDTSVVPSGPRPALDKVWLPASAMRLKSGTPTQVDTMDQGPLWSFATTGTNVVHGVLEVPSTWDVVNFYALWIQTTSTGFSPSNNVCRCRLRVKGLGDPGYATPPATAGIIAIAALPDVTLAANNATAGGKKTTSLGQTKLQQFGYGSTFALEFSRLGDDALDNYSDPLLLLGIMAVRAS